MTRRVLVALWLAVLPVMALAGTWQEHEGIAALFERAGVQGTFVVRMDDGRLVGHDEARARTRYVPASTFKIPNALIALSRGIVRDLEQPLPYGGQPQPFPQWERDMPLGEAFALSNVPVFQGIARSVGPALYRKDLARFGYGNAEIGERVDRFWLDGPLAISAVEQVDFLGRLAEGRLPYSPGAQRAVCAMALTDSGAGWVLYGKTGWQNAPGAGVGWWVGWVVRAGRVHPFALNLDIRREEDAVRRMQIGRAALAQLGLLP